MSVIDTLKKGLTRPKEKAQASAPSGSWANGHLLADTRSKETWATYMPGAVEWEGADASSRANALDDFAQTLAGLVDKNFRIWARVTSEPFPAESFRQGLIESAPHGNEALGDYAAGAARAIELSAARVHRPFISVRIADTALTREHLGKVLGQGVIAPQEGSVGQLWNDLNRADSVLVNGGGYRRLSELQTALVVSSSTALGFSPSARSVKASTDPYQTMTTLRAIEGGEAVTRFVQVLRAEDWEDRDAVEVFPWLAWAQTRQSQTEAVLCGDLIDARDLIAGATRTARQNASIDSIDTDQGYASRGEVAYGARRSVEVRDELKSGSRVERHRFRGRLMFAVVGSTPEETAELGRELVADAASELDLELTVNFGQYEDYLSFILGRTRWEFDGHRTSQSLACVSAGLPQANQGAGDPVGMLFGRVAESNTLFVHDPHGKATPNRPKVHVAVGEPGSGKSTLFGFGIYHERMLGRRVTVNDPSGNLARLAQLPAFKDDARVVQATGGGHEGLLMPHYLVPDPRREDCGDDAEYLHEVKKRGRERSSLAIDLTLLCLPWSVVDTDDGSIVPAVEDAVAEVGSAFGTHSREIIDALETKGGTVGKRLAQHLKARAKNGTDGVLIFPEGDLDPDAARRLVSSAGLTIVTTPGLSVPPAGLARSSWLREHHEAAPILLGVSRLAAQSLWADKSPKAHFDDELGITSGSQAFGSMLTRFSYDSRKFDASIWLAFQTMLAIDRLPDDGFDSLIGPRFVFRTSGPTAESAARRLVGAKWAGDIPGLGDGECIVSDWKGRPRRTRVDMSWWDGELVKALNTTPAGPVPVVEGAFGEFC